MGAVYTGYTGLGQGGRASRRQMTFLARAIALALPESVQLLQVLP